MPARGSLTGHTGVLTGKPERLRTGEPLRDELAWAGLAPSGGSSGGADTVTPSHVLEAVGIPITGSLRFWVHPGTSAADVERLLAVLPGIVERLRTDADAGAR